MTRTHTINIRIMFVPLHFGIKEKIMAIRYFKSAGLNHMIRFLSSPANTDEEKLSEIREIMKAKWTAKLYTKLTELKEKGDISDFKMHYDYDKEIVFDMMADTESRIEYFEKEWKKQTSIINPKGLGLRCIGVKIETKRGDFIGSKIYEKRTTGCAGGSSAI